MSYTPQIEFYKKRQFGDKLNATFVFIRENAKPFLKAQLLIAGPILLLLNILINQFTFDFLGLGFEPDNFTANDIIRIVKLYGVLLISSVITGAVMPAVSYTYMKKYQTSPPDEITNANLLGGLGGKIFNLVGLNIVSFIMLGAVIFLLSLVVGFTGAVSPFLIFFSGTLALVVVAYIGVSLTLGSSIIVFEDNNPLDAIGRCFKLIRGKWWSTFGLIIVVGILGFIINQLFGLPRTILFGIKAITSFESGDVSNLVQMSSSEQGLNVLFATFETFGSIITNSLIFIALAFQYFNLVERRESRGLLSQIEQIDEQSNDEDEEVY